MPVVLEENQTRCSIRLSGQVDITAAAELKQHLLYALTLQRKSPPGPPPDSSPDSSPDLGPDLGLDLSGLERTDITILQLLWAAEREASRAGKAWLLESASPRFYSDMLLQAGLAPGLATRVKQP